MRVFYAIALAACVVATPRNASSQSASSLLEEGIRAYNSLSFETAAGFLRLSLFYEAQDQPSPAVRQQALTYLGATEVFLGAPDSSAVRFRELLLLNPRYRLDRLTFPPEVSVVFDAVRRGVRAVTVETAPQTTIRVGQGAFVAQVYAATPHTITAEVLRSVGGRVATLHIGPVGDSLELRWDPVGGSGDPVPTGRYVLSVTSQGANRRPARQIRIPLDLQVRRSDTLPHPAEPEDSLFLEEREPKPTGIKKLPVGLAAAVGVVVLPPIIAPGSNLLGARFAVVGGVSIAGLLGFLNPPPGPIIPENVRANEAIRQAWQDRVDFVTQENERRAANIRVIIRAGTPTTTDLQRP